MLDEDILFQDYNRHRKSLDQTIIKRLQDIFEKKIIASDTTIIETILQIENSATRREIIKRFKLYKENEYNEIENKLKNLKKKQKKITLLLLLSIQTNITLITFLL